MNKILIVIIILAIAGTAFFLFFKRSGQLGNSAIERPVSSLPTTGNINIPASDLQGNFISIGTSHGAVTVKNFYQSSIGVDEQFVILAKNKDYEINYDTYTSGFSIYVSAAPLETNLTAAENSFLNILGVSQGDACKLNVWVAVPISVDPDNAGRNLGLSFCGRGL